MNAFKNGIRIDDGTLLINMLAVLRIAIASFNLLYMPNKMIIDIINAALKI